MGIRLAVVEVDHSSIGTAGVGARAVKLSTTDYRVVSVPYPIHRAEVRQISATQWSVDIVTVLRKQEVTPTLRTALRTAGVLVTAAYRVDWRRKYTSLQRFAIGALRCPEKLKNTIPIRADASLSTMAQTTLCFNILFPGSIWCPEHNVKKGGAIGSK